MTARWKIGRWKRATLKSGRKLFFKDGKFTSRKKFESAIFRRAVKEISTRGQDEGTRRYWAGLVADKSKLAKKIKIKSAIRGIGAFARRTDFDFCSTEDRQEFFDQIIADYSSLRSKLTPIQYSQLRVIFLVDKKRGKSYRSFIDLQKLKNFLGLNYRYGQSRSDLPAWTKRKGGMCRTKKEIYLAIRKTRGERVIGEKRLSRYSYRPIQ